MTNGLVPALNTFSAAKKRFVEALRDGKEQGLHQFHYVHLQGVEAGAPWYRHQCQSDGLHERLHPWHYSKGNAWGIQPCLFKRKVCTLSFRPLSCVSTDLVQAHNYLKRSTKCSTSRHSWRTCQTFSFWRNQGSDQVQLLWPWWRSSFNKGWFNLSCSQNQENDGKHLEG